MYFDAGITPNSLSEVPALARAAEAAGLAAVWTSETQHNPFLPLPLVAEHTTRLRFGTAVAIGFGRSPITLAHVAWDLSAQSGGRFMLGLGTQVRAHIERRFGMEWPASPTGKLRELVLALRAIWQSWQTGERLNYRGDYYKLTLMTPFFNPGPIAQPRVPIFIAGVNTGLARLAGEVCDGFHVHPYHSPAYLRDVLLPAIAEGAAKAGRPVTDLEVAGTVFAFTSPAEREGVRQQISFYASTPTYRPVMAHHGWESTAEQLSALAAHGEWAAMPALRERYEGLLGRVALYRGFKEGEDGWEKLAAETQA